MWQRSSDFGVVVPQSASHHDGEFAVDCPRWREALRHPELTGLSLFAPESYTPSYAYPLIGYLHDDERSERDLWNWFPGISEQNFLGMGIRATVPGKHGMPGRYRWLAKRPDATLAALRDAFEAVMQDWNVHPERITLLGEGQGALVSLQQFFLQQAGLDDSLPPLAGTICGSLPRGWTDLLPLVPVAGQGRLLFLDPLQEGEEFAVIDALSEAGFEVTFAGPEDHNRPALINHWLMSAISTAVF